MTKVIQDNVQREPHENKVQQAMEQIKMALDSMSARNDAGCIMHLKKAEALMGNSG